MCVYDAALWTKYNVGTKRKLVSCYNKCVKIFFGYKQLTVSQGCYLNCVFPALIQYCIIAP